MAIAYLILTIVFALRNIIIVLFAAGSWELLPVSHPAVAEFCQVVFVYFIVVYSCSLLDIHRCRWDSIHSESSA